MEIVNEYSDDLIEKLDKAYSVINTLNIELRNYSEMFDRLEREQNQNIEQIIKIKEENIKLRELNNLLDKIVEDKNKLVELNNNLILENEKLINTNKQLIDNIEELNKENNLLKEYNYIQ